LTFLRDSKKDNLNEPNSSPTLNATSELNPTKKITSEISNAPRTTDIIKTNIEITSPVINTNYTINTTTEPLSSKILPDSSQGLIKIISKPKPKTVPPSTWPSVDDTEYLVVKNILRSEEYASYIPSPRRKIDKITSFKKKPYSKSKNSIVLAPSGIKRKHEESLLPKTPTLKSTDPQNLPTKSPPLL